LDAIPSTGGIEAACKHFCIGPESGLSDTKSVIVIVATAGLADQARDAAGTIGKMAVQPFGKQPLEFMWQAQKDVTRL
jgi:hypothetical protein